MDSGMLNPLCWRQAFLLHLLSQRKNILPHLLPLSV
jgi:hypothetical protein